MIDMEKAIKTLESILDADIYENWLSEEERESVCDVLDLLKEPEAVKPIPPEDEFGLYRCGNCHHQLFRCVDKYCSRCGQAVKWND